MTLAPRARPRLGAPAAVAVSLAALFSLACGGKSDGHFNAKPGAGGTDAVTGGTGGATGGVGGSGGGKAGSNAGGSAGSSAGATGGSAGSPPLSMGGVKLRLLTQAEYRASLRSLFGTVETPLELPDDVSVGGFVSIGASQVAVNPSAAEKYERASLAVVEEVFGDTERWQTLVGCQPEADLGDACVETFVPTFGRGAFRRDVTDEEAAQWVQVARTAATLAGNAAQGLSTLTSAMLQSPSFLYRAETNTLDPENGRLKYDGRSMAVRLAYLLTGGPPSPELLAAGESGQLDTADGVRSAADSMLSDPALVEQLTSFFYEYTRAELVARVEKSPELFPEFNDGLRSSMREGTRLFLEKVVLAPGGDVRTFFDSDQTFADAALAPIYGVTPPDSGFAQFTLAPSSGRAGIMGQAAVLAALSKPDHSSPTDRGSFMLEAFFCQRPNSIPDGENTAVMMGMGLEHFDSIGSYRDTENGATIDASGTLPDGTEFNGAVELGTALRESTAVTECLLRHFYRSVNGREDDVHDQQQVDAMMASLTSHDYVFRDLIADFVLSDAFRSAPALPLTDENP